METSKNLFIAAFTVENLELLNKIGFKETDGEDIDDDAAILFAIDKKTNTFWVSGTEFAPSGSVMVRSKEIQAWAA